MQSTCLKTKHLNLFLKKILRFSIFVKIVSQKWLMNESLTVNLYDKSHNLTAIFCFSNRNFLSLIRVSSSFSGPHHVFRMTERFLYLVIYFQYHDLSVLKVLSCSKNFCFNQEHILIKEKLKKLTVIKFEDT